MRKSTFITVSILLCFAFNSGSFSQSFRNEILIDVPGKNYNFDIFSIDEYYPHTESYITWINEIDSIFTVYLKKISPEMGDNIVIASDNIMKLNPKISMWGNIKIAWQNYIDNYYQIILCNYSNDSLCNKTILCDSLLDNPQISLSSQRITWIEEGNLFFKEVYPAISKSILIDSINCSSPNIKKNDNEHYTKILYVKEENGDHLIHLAEYFDGSTPHWGIEAISVGYNRNPQFGMLGGISFENFDQNVWKIKYTYNGDTDHLHITNNNSCNYKNSYLFSYGIATGSTESKTPFFVAFDSDSLENNNEIFIRTYQFGYKDSLINISNMEGNDYEPKVAYTSRNDTLYVSILWIHEDESKSNIWMTSAVFNPILGTVEYQNINPSSYFLFQNYPNPFNPYTNIEYYIRKTSHVRIEVYDTLGKKIMTLKEGIEKPGVHKIIFDGSNLASGTYYYTLNFGGIKKSRSMTLVR